jgi:hypothetical protein
MWWCQAVVRSRYQVVRHEPRPACHRSGCGAMIPRCTATPHCHVEDSTAKSHIAGTWTGGIGDADTHCSAGAESYYVRLSCPYVLRTTARRSHTPLKSEVPVIAECTSKELSVNRGFDLMSWMDCSLVAAVCRARWHDVCGVAPIALPHRADPRARGSIAGLQSNVPA